jgi:hypothetical protein
VLDFMYCSPRDISSDVKTGMTLIWRVLQEVPPLVAYLAFKLLVERCFHDLNQMGCNGIGSYWSMVRPGRSLSCTESAGKCPPFATRSSETHL